MLQHLADGRVDLMMGRGNMVPSTRFGRTFATGSPSPTRTTPSSMAVARGRRRLGGPLQDRLDRLHLHTHGRWTACRRSSGTVHPQPEIAEQAAYYGDGFFHNNIFWPKEHVQRMVGLYRERFEPTGMARQTRPSSDSAARSMRHDSQQAIRSSARTSTSAGLGGGPRSRTTWTRRRSPSARRSRSSTGRSPSATSSATTSVSCSSSTMRDCRYRSCWSSSRCWAAGRARPPSRVRDRTARDVPDAPLHPRVAAAPGAVEATARPGGERMTSTSRSLVVVSAGLSQPSSTRCSPTAFGGSRPAPARDRIEPTIEVIELRIRPGPDEPPPHRLPEPEAPGAIDWSWRLTA